MFIYQTNGFLKTAYIYDHIFKRDHFLASINLNLHVGTENDCGVGQIASIIHF